MIVINMLDYFPDWWEEAQCKSADSEIFFGNDTSTGRLNAARFLCASCPVAGDCLSHALQEPERFGIWAGTSAAARAAMVRDVEDGTEVRDIVDYVLKHRFRWRRDV